MNDRDKSKEQLLEELESLRLEVAELRTVEAAFNVQSELLENLVTMARSSAEGQLLKATLKNTLDVATRLSEAERGSLFLLDSNGAIAASLLTRKNATAEESSQLIGIVLDKGLAGWVSRHRQVGLIADTEQDDRWLTLPNQPYEVRSALTIPILRGQVLQGILTLLHSQPGHFGTKEALLMKATAEQIALVLENAELYTKLDESHSALTKTKEALQNELEKGKQIQREFLPDSLVQPPGWEIAACFYPAREVAGDFYDAFELPGGYVGLVIADVCDKGVGAALFMALFRSLIRLFSGQISLLESDNLPEYLSGAPEYVVKLHSPNYSAEIDALRAVELTNNYIAQTHWQMGMFATMFFGVLNPATGLLTYVNGGHEPPIIIGLSGVKKRLQPTGPAVGMMPKMKFKTQQVQLEPGDTLITYTDGVPEARNPEGKFFTEAKLLYLVEQHCSCANDLLGSIEMSLREHIADTAQFDDITMLAVRRAE
ncbi:PP2C family protein-serine/threonine phosphatase [Argonema antarcticum]|uniref:PP2C family protein-serine/threonine phosphatase n=1 Tax=Argonema antarcticum TaxID=2942763 RepID=UPI0020138508|nr:GAF domain-containing SpoIIE family protein phosphatase [Argonema antarcticum]MCL1470582.1 SpoIIE family protein phosphatase [Argonema antarcticum A004/B2]